jgi:hypothetical protein
MAGLRFCGAWRIFDVSMFRYLEPTLSANPRHDEVTNFGIAKDTPQFNATLFANFAAAMASATQSGANTVFTIDANDTVTLDNITKSNLTASNFRFV